MKLLLLSAFLFTNSSFATTDQVELQWAICTRDPQQVATTLGSAGGSKSEMLSIYDNDTQDYLAQGFAFRVERKKKKVESQVKVKSSPNRTVPAEGKCEFDRYGSDTHFSCKLTHDITRADSPWSAEQIAFGEKFAKVEWASLREFGPYKNTKWEANYLGHDFSIEALEGPNSRQITEVSARVAKSESEEKYLQFTAALEKLGIPLCKRQRGKAERVFDAD